MPSDVGEVLRSLVTRLGVPTESLERMEAAVRELVRAETSRAVRAMGLATSAELERLAAQVADLKRAVAEAAPVGSATTTTARSSSGASGSKASGSRASGSKASGSTASGTGGSRPRKRPTTSAADA